GDEVHIGMRSAMYSAASPCGIYRFDQGCDRPMLPQFGRCSSQAYGNRLGKNPAFLVGFTAHVHNRKRSCGGVDWTGNFRTRLAKVLGTESQPGGERLRPLWAAWSVGRNLAGGRF